MKRHVLLTGEIGCGKSTVLAGTLALLGPVSMGGVQTYYEEPRSSEQKTLYLRAWGSAQKGTLLARLPGDDFGRITAVFDTAGTALLEDAQAELIVVDEIGRLERDAHLYQAALRRLLDGDVPVLGVIRKHKAAWADWVRSHPAVTLLEVTADNRDDVPREAAQLIAGSLAQQA